MGVLGPHVFEGVPLTVTAERAGVSVRTARRWLAAYRAAGSAGLVRSRRSDLGGHRMSGELVEVIEGLALRRPPPKIAQVHRAVAVVARQRGVSAPSYYQVRRVVRSLDPGLLALAHGGRDAYRDGFELVARRESLRPNDMWQADHTLLDVMVLDEAGRPVRPWLTTILDDHSRAVAGYMVFVGEPSAGTTALALRQAIWRKDQADWPVCGIPSVLYVDNGPDFTSGRIAQVAADLHVQLIHSTKGVPRGRGKEERLFGSITTELLPTLPGHIPHGNNGKPVTRPGLSLPELDQVVGEWVTGTYHHRVHPETGQAPVDRWVGSGWLPRMPTSLDELNLLLLLVVTPRKVQRDGIHLHGLRYLAVTLAAYVGESVTIRYDPRDLAEIRVYHHDEFLCTAVAPAISTVTVSVQDLVAARNQRRRELRQHLVARRSLAELLTSPAARHRAPGARERENADTPEPERPRLKLYRED